MIGKSPAGSIGRWGSNIASSMVTDTSVATWAVEDLSTSAVVFAGTGGRLSGDSGQFVWDATANRLGIGLASPGYTVEIAMGSSANMQLRGGVSSTGVALSAANNGDTVNIPLELRGSSVMVAVGNLVFSSGDNSLDIGNTGSGRPRIIYAGTAISPGSTAVAGAGAIRLGNASEIRWRNAADNNDAAVVSVAATNVLTFDASTETSFLIGGARRVSFAGDGITSTASVIVGVTPAATGVVRMPNNGYVTARTAGNTSDIPFIGCDTSNRLNLEANTQSLVILNASTQSTVSSTGVAASLPLLPQGYWKVLLGGVERVIPYYNASS
mgnify:FL=1